MSFLTYRFPISQELRYPVRELGMLSRNNTRIQEDNIKKSILTGGIRMIA